MKSATGRSSFCDFDVHVREERGVAWAGSTAKDYGLGKIEAVGCDAAQTTLALRRAILDAWRSAVQPLAQTHQDARGLASHREASCSRCKRWVGSLVMPVCGGCRGVICLKCRTCGCSIMSWR
jgi:hypothetical protein